jgi:hypothetical protein
MSLQEATEFILDSGDAARWLKLLDLYLGQYLKMPSGFVLPREYAVLAPILAALVKRPEKFPAYILGIRDTLPRGEEVEAVNTLYRTVMTRYVQQERRARMAAALDKAVELYGPMSRDQRLRYESKVYTLWGRRRTELLKRAAKSTGRGRLSVEERAEILALFWKEIDNEIAAGDLPPVEGP